MAKHKKKATLNYIKNRTDKKRPLFYTFSTYIIQIVIVLKLETSISFRGISKVLTIFSEFSEFRFETPKHTTIISSIKKLGIYNLEKPKEKADDWVIILDESIEFGNEKRLVILGIREKNIDFTRALKYQDLITLSIKISNSWKGEDIKKEIDLVKKEIGHIKYAVADMGNALKKGLRISSIYHVVDITHKISWFIKQLYSKEERFMSYTKKLAHLRGSIPLSKLAYILPPTQRVHSRYMNLKPIVDWGNSIIHLLKSKKELKQEREKLGFVKDYKKFLKEIDTIITFAIKIQKIIKNKGLSKKTIDLCEKIFSKNQHNEKIIRFKEQIMGYLKETLAIEQEIKSPKLLCTSDILESCFGKYKSMINSNKSLGITDLCLTIAAITSDYRNEQEIFNAMKNIRTKEVIQWKNKNIGKTLLARRREVLKKVGCKKNQKIKIFNNPPVRFV